MLSLYSLWPVWRARISCEGAPESSYAHACFALSFCSFSWGFRPDTIQTPVMAVLWRPVLHMAEWDNSLSYILPLICNPHSLRGMLAICAGLVLAVPGPRKHTVCARAAAEGLQQ